MNNKRLLSAYKRYGHNNKSRDGVAQWPILIKNRITNNNNMIFYIILYIPEGHTFQQSVLLKIKAIIVRC